MFLGRGQAGVLGVLALDLGVQHRHVAGFVDPGQVLEQVPRVRVGDDVGGVEHQGHARHPDLLDPVAARAVDAGEVGEEGDHPGADVVVAPHVNQGQGEVAGDVAE